MVLLSVASSLSSSTQAIAYKSRGMASQLLTPQAHISIDSSRVAPVPARRASSLRTPRSVAVCASAPAKIELNKAPPSPIQLTDGALAHLRKLRAERGEATAVLRVGVKSGGCSGMSYTMDFEESEVKRPDDTVLSFADGEIEVRIDPKSLLYLFGLQLDYSSELIGGGYRFFNPNASASCGCGTSFSV